MLEMGNVGGAVNNLETVGKLNINTDFLRGYDLILLHDIYMYWILKYNEIFKHYDMWHFFCNKTNR